MSTPLADLKIERSSVPGGGRGRSKNPWPWLLAACLTAGVVGFFAVRPRAIEVEVATAAMLYPAQGVTLLSATGYVVPQRKADIASKATGRVERLEVEEGQTVVKDQILARLENRDTQATLAEAEARVDLAKAELKQAEAEAWVADLAVQRLRGMVDRKLAMAADLDAATARQRSAVAGVARAEAAVEAQSAVADSARVALEYTLIRAPFDGVVLKKSADVGDVVAPFAATTLSKGAVVTMADMASLQVEADVSESNLGKVRVDQPCEIQLDALPDVRLLGRVQRIVPTVDRAKATVTVKVRFVDQDPRVLPDMSAKVAFLARELEAIERSARLAVPVGALADGGVFLLDGEHVRRVSVETAGNQDNSAIVRSGLTAGQDVVVNPPRDLTDGAMVTRKQP